MMAQMKAADSYVQAVQALPLRLRQEALSLTEGDRARTEELRDADIMKSVYPR